MSRRSWIVPSAVAVSLALTGTAQGAISFGPPTESPAGQNPTDVAVGGLSRDGRLDVAVTTVSAFSGPLNPRVRIGLSDTAGGFSSLTDYATAPGVSTVAIPTPGRGLTTLVLPGTDGLSRMTSDDQGVLGPLTTYPGPPSSGPVVIADVNGDGVPDAASIRQIDANSGRLVVYRGLGDGGYALLGSRAVRGPTAIAAGYIDGDDVADLAIGRADGKVVIASGQRDGMPVNSRVISTGQGSITGLATGDFDKREPRIDLAVAFANPDPNTGGGVQVLRNRPDDRWGRRPVWSDAYVPAELAAADFDADDDLDLVAGSSGTTRATVLANNGTGVLTPSAQLAVGDRADQVAVGNLNGDNRVDVVALAFFNRKITTFLNTSP